MERFLTARLMSSVAADLGIVLCGSMPGQTHPLSLAGLWEAGVRAMKGLVWKKVETHSLSFEESVKLPECHHSLSLSPKANLITNLIHIK